jgi:glycosyltransferase involved in cell wall biosynthesis
LRRWTARVCQEARSFVRQSRPDAILATAHPGDAIVLGLALGLEYRIPVIADLRDPWSYWPMPLYTHWIDFLAERRLERQSLSRCARVITTTEASAQLARDKLGVAEERLRVIPNGYFDDDFLAEGAAEDIEPGPFVIVHTGELSKTSRPGLLRRFVKRLGFQYDPLRTNYNARSPYYLLAALEKLVNEDPTLRSRVQMWFVGDLGLAGDWAIQRFPYPEMVRVLGRAPQEQAARYCRRADLLLLPHLQTFLGGRPFCVAIPGKLYTYLRSGGRILACGQPSEMWDLVERFDAGQTVLADDVGQIAAAIRREIEDWRHRPTPRPPQPLRELPDFDREALAGRVAEEVRQILGESPRQIIPVLQQAIR